MQLRQRLGLMATVLALCAGCAGGDAVNSAESETVEPETTAVAENSASAEASEIDSEEWRSDLGAAWASLQMARDEAAVGYLTDVFENGENEVVGAVSLFEAEATALETLRMELPGSPADPALAEPYGQLVEAVNAESESARATADELGTDTDVLRAEYDEASDQDTTRYVELRRNYLAANDTTTAACFDVQAAIDAAGLDAFFCLPESDGPPPGEEGGEEGAPPRSDLDPTVEATPLFEPVLLAPGRHEFTIFERSLVLTTTEELFVESGSAIVSVSPDGADFGVAILSVDDVADPSRLAEFDMGAVPTMALPSDVAAWLAELPLLINEQGVQSIDGIEAPWWDLSVDAEATAGVLPDPFFNLFDEERTPAHGFVDEAVVQRLWFVDSPSGAVFIYATGAPWADQAEMVDFADALFAGIDLTS